MGNFKSSEFVRLKLQTKDRFSLVKNFKNQDPFKNMSYTFPTLGIYDSTHFKEKKSLPTPLLSIHIWNNLDVLNPLFVVANVINDRTFREITLREYQRRSIDKVSISIFTDHYIFNGLSYFLPCSAWCCGMTFTKILCRCSSSLMFWRISKDIQILTT